MFQSIRRRLIALHVLAVLAASVVLPVALYWRVSSTATELHHRALRDQADQIAHYLHRDGQQLRLDMPDAMMALYSTSYGRYIFAVLDPKGTILFSAGLHGGPLNRPRRDTSPVYFNHRGADGRLMSGANVPVSVDGIPVIIQVAEDETHRDVLIDDIVSEFLPHVAWVVLPILLVMLTTDLLIFRATLRPLTRASRLAERISPERTDLRLPEDGMPTELQPLVRAVNAALERLAHGIASQREFVADAAHELRTPLAVLRAQAETLGDRASAAPLLADIDAMSRVVNQMLDAADTEALTLLGGETADLAAIAAEVAAFMAPVAVAEGKDIALLGAEMPLTVAGSHPALFRAVRNLVENAIRHTPRGTAVEIEVIEQGAVAVRDHGPGVPEAEREAIFQRFWRGDRAREGSAGLGLAIVARTARTHGGTVEVATAPRGGAVFTLRLQRAGEA